METSFYTRDGKQTAIMKNVKFNDEIERFIITHDQVPESYWPNTVYKCNETEPKYDVIGTYSISYTNSTQWINPRTNVWEGVPSVKTYYFHKK